jgi:hypothetical protein
MTSSDTQTCRLVKELGDMENPPYHAPGQQSPLITAGVLNFPRGINKFDTEI